MHININIRTPVARLSESDFVVPILVDIIAPGKFSTEGAEDDPLSEYVVGRVWSERLDWALAEAMGISPVQVCDAASATWLQVYETLSTKKGNGFRRDLNLDTFVNELFFIHEFLIHPDISDRVAVLDAVMNGMSGDNSLVLMHYEQGLPHHIDDWEYRDLGFKKIARSSLLIRDNHFRYPFGDLHCGGREVDFSGTAEHEEWLLDHWDNLIADHPSL